MIVQLENDRSDLSSEDFKKEILTSEPLTENFNTANEDSENNKSNHELVKIDDSVQNDVNAKKVIIFEYDDLAPSKNINFISTQQFTNRFRNDWKKFDAIKFRNIIELLKKYDERLPIFVLTNFDKEKFFYLTKLQGAEAIDFVLNQFNLYSQEYNSYQLFFPTYTNNHPVSNFNIKLSKINFSYNSEKFFQNFYNKTVNYFLHQKIVNENQRNALNLNLSKNYLNYKYIKNFLKPVGEILSQNKQWLISNSNQYLFNDLNYEGYRKRIVARKISVK